MLAASARNNILMFPEWDSLRRRRKSRVLHLNNLIRLIWLMHPCSGDQGGGADSIIIITRDIRSQGIIYTARTKIHVNQRLCCRRLGGRRAIFNWDKRGTTESVFWCWLHEKTFRGKNALLVPRQITCRVQPISFSLITFMTPWLQIFKPGCCNENKLRKFQNFVAQLQ